MNETHELYDDAIRALLGFPSAGCRVGGECLFRPTFHHEAALFLSVGDDVEGELVVRVATRSIYAYVDRSVVSRRARSLRSRRRRS